MLEALGVFGENVCETNVLLVFLDSPEAILLKVQQRALYSPYRGSNTVDSFGECVICDSVRVCLFFLNPKVKVANFRCSFKKKNVLKIVQKECCVEQTDAESNM